MLHCITDFLIFFVILVSINSTTISLDVKDKETAHLILLSLTEMTSMRLRDSGKMCTLVAENAKTHV